MDSNTKRQEIIELAKKGGDNASLLLLDKIHLLQEQLEILQEEIKKDPPEDAKVERVAMKLATKLSVLEKGDTGEKGEKGDPGKDGKDGRNGKDGRDGRDGRDGADGIDGKNPDPSEVSEMVMEKIKVPAIEEIENDLPKLGEQIRDGLELLKGDDRLDKSAVKGLEELEKAIKTSPNPVAYPVGGGRNVVEYIDLTSQCNGVTKTFNVPKRARWIALHGTQFPGIYRKTTDYTGEGTGILTLTSEVSAPETGQTLILLCSRT